MTWRHEKPILLIDQCHHTVAQLESENKRLFWTENGILQQCEILCHPRQHFTSELFISFRNILKGS